MGAQDFMVTARGRTAREAFDAAVGEARYEHGHGGYTGTIAEKHYFNLIACPEGKDPRAYAQELQDVEDPRYEDKWGPALCLDLGDGTWLFFGLASS